MMTRLNADPRVDRPAMGQHLQDCLNGSFSEQMNLFPEKF